MRSGRFKNSSSGQENKITLQLRPMAFLLLIQFIGCRNHISAHTHSRIRQATVIQSISMVTGQAARPGSDCESTRDRRRRKTEDRTTDQCQICLEAFPMRRMVKRLCHAQCPARVCRHCLTQHVRVSLSACIVGMLPRIRCPICLVPLEKARWERRVTDSKHSSFYRRMCQRACGFQSPCCHMVNYTHLPPSYERGEILADRRARVSDDLARLQALYYAREITSRRIVEYLLQHMNSERCEELESLLHALLVNMYDEERRATLLLSFLYQRPRIWTHCCRAPVCFTCKRMEHHDVCPDPALDGQECLVQCRQCKVMIVKVEGCDVLTCLCGFVMHWEAECRLRRLSPRKLIPIDLFDVELIDSWIQWQRLFASVASAIISQPETQTKRRRSSMRQIHRRLTWRWSSSQLTVRSFSHRRIAETAAEGALYLGLFVLLCTFLTLIINGLCLLLVYKAQSTSHTREAPEAKASQATIGGRC